METISLTALAVFLAPYLHKAGEKVAEKTVEELFNARTELAERFSSLFKTDIISLNIGDSAPPTKIASQLELQPEVKEGIRKKIEANQDLLVELVETSEHMPHTKFGGITINAKNIGQAINNPYAPITQTNTFS
jgi:hypothetical protein